MTARSLLAAFGLLLCSSLLAEPVLRVGTNLWPGYEPLYLAREIGNNDWDQATRLVEYPSATEVLRAFRNRAIEAAGLTLDEVLLLRQDQVPVKVVLVMDISAGGDVIIARKGIDEVKQLAGKRVGVESGALGAYMLTRALEIHGLPLQEIDIVHLDVSGHRQAFESGQVDAVVTFDPVRTQLLAAGGRVIFDSREIPGEVVDVLVVYEQTLQEQPERIAQLVENWFRALALIEKEPRRAASLMGRRLSLSADQVLDSYQGLHLPGIAENHRLLHRQQADLSKTLNRLHRVMVERQLLSHEVRIDQLLTPAYLPEP